MNDTTAVVADMLINFDPNLNFNATLDARQYFKPIATDDGMIPHSASHAILFVLLGFMMTTSVIATAILCHRYGFAFKFLRNNPAHQTSKVVYKASTSSVDECADLNTANEPDVTIMLPRN